MSDNKKVTIKEASAIRKIPMPTLKKYCQQGKFPNATLEESPIGKYWLIPLSELEAVEIPPPGRPSKKKIKS